MPIIDLFSKRQKRLRGEVPDVYVYNALPEPLRVQIVHIWMDVLGNQEQAQYHRSVMEAYAFIVKALCREYGVFVLPGARESYGSRDCVEDLVDFFIRKEITKELLMPLSYRFRL